LTTSIIALDRGRSLQVTVEGDPSGLPILIHHGTPGSCVLLPDWISDAERRGLRLISFSRAGYGLSTRAPGRDVAQVVQDVLPILDELGVDRCATWGLSGGGPHALACAALLPDRVVAVSCISGVAPFSAVGLDWMAGMGGANVEEFSLAVSGDHDALLSAGEGMAAALRTSAPEQLIEEMASLLSAEDLAIMRSDFGRFVHESMVEGLRENAFGLYDDDLAVISPWGFDPADIRLPAQVWQGGQDLMVPWDHGRWLAQRIPGAEAHLVASMGHLTVAARGIPEVHDWLASHF